MGRTIKLTNDTYLVNDLYKTNEIRVGTWIDGKPLYRKTFTKTGSSANNEYIGNISSVDTIKSIDIFLKKGNVIRNGVTCYYGNLAWASQVYFNSSTGYLSIECGNSFADFKDGATIIAAVEYTKTTD